MALDIAKLKRWYKMKLWTKKMLADAVNSGELTADQYEEITGEKYTAE